MSTAPQLYALMGWYRKSDHPTELVTQLIGVFDWPDGDDRWLTLAASVGTKFEGFKRIKCVVNEHAA